MSGLARDAARRRGFAAPVLPGAWVAHSGHVAAAGSGGMERSAACAMATGCSGTYRDRVHKASTQHRRTSGGQCNSSSSSTRCAHGATSLTTSLTSDAIPCRPRRRAVVLAPIPPPLQCCLTAAHALEASAPSAACTCPCSSHQRAAAAGQWAALRVVSSSDCASSRRPCLT